MIRRRPGLIAATDPAPQGQGVVASQIRTLRRQRKLTLDQLSAATGLDKGYLSRVERQHKVPSIAALLKVADALGVQMGHLFGEKVDPGAIALVRRRDRKPFAEAIEGAAHRYEALVHGGPLHDLEAFILYAGPGGEDESATHAGHEMIYVLQGTITVGFVDHTVVLEDGDCLHFPGSLRHRIAAANDQPATALIVIARDAPRGARPNPDHPQPREQFE